MKPWMVWLESRLPNASPYFRKHFSAYFVPRALNFWYVFGCLLLCAIALLVISGGFLLVHYKPDEKLAHQSIEAIMAQVPWGWLIRYMHTTSVSLLFIGLYLHIFRGLLYSSYKRPKELVWVLGCVLFFLCLSQAMTGYILPWGQMSYWGATVLLNLIKAAPFLGDVLVRFLNGTDHAEGATIGHAFALHVFFIPILLLIFIVLHIKTLHEVGSGSPDNYLSMQPKKAADVDCGTKKWPKGMVPFFPYMVVKDFFAMTIFLLIGAAIVFFAPTMAGYFVDAGNQQVANPLMSPDRLRPMWYISPFFAILRSETVYFRYVLTAMFLISGLLCLRKRLLLICFVLMVMAICISVVPSAVFSLILLCSSIAIWFLLPWIDKHPQMSIHQKPVVHRFIYIVFALNFIGLGLLGLLPSSQEVLLAQQAATVLYWAFFLYMPWWSRLFVKKRPPEGCHN